MTEKESAHILVCADGRFAPGAWISIWSAWSQWKGSQTVQFHLLTKDTSDPAMSRIRMLADELGIRLEIQAANTQSVDSLSTSRFSECTYLRVLAPRFLQGVKKFLYLDADVLVRDSLHPLFELPEDKPLLAIGEYGIWNLREGLPYLNLEGERARQPYFNTGVLLINVEAWNRNDTTEKIVDFLQEHKADLRCADQDGINAVLGGIVQPLDYTWNFQMGGFEYLDIIGWPEERADLKARREQLGANPKIAHFLFKTMKPWQGYMAEPFTDEYREAIRASKWNPPATQFRLNCDWFLKHQLTKLRRLKSKIGALGRKLGVIPPVKAQ